jgi:hypothetical protein
MMRVVPFFGSLVLAVSSFAQQPNAPQPNPNSPPNAYSEGQPTANYPYSRRVERSSGGWGLFGLLGLLGLLVI